MKIDIFAEMIKNEMIKSLRGKVMNISDKEAAHEIAVTGRIDTNTSPQLEAHIKELAKTTDEIILNLSAVEYISSAGLRVLLIAHKLMAAKGGSFSIKSPSDFCRQVFEATGMDGALKIV